MPSYSKDKTSSSTDLWKSNQAKMLNYGKEWKYLPEWPEDRQSVAKYDVRERNSPSRYSPLSLPLSGFSSLFIISSNHQTHHALTVISPFQARINTGGHKTQNSRDPQFPEVVLQR
ncbi:hypothetical protein ABVT39_007271 [Epinephelus coioides]